MNDDILKISLLMQVNNRLEDFFSADSPERLTNYSNGNR